MTRLYGSAVALFVVFSAALGFFGATAWASWWVWAVVGGVLLVAFFALGGLLVPPSRAAVAPRDRTSASMVLQVLGALCTLEVLLLGLVLWIWGNRTYNQNSAYQVLGLLIFLALLGIGAPGALVTSVRLLRERALLHNAERAEQVRQAGAAPAHH